MNDITDIAEVYDLLYRLGFSATNTAFFQLSYAVYHNFELLLIGSVFLSNHILTRFEFLGKWRIGFPFYFANDNFTQFCLDTLFTEWALPDSCQPLIRLSQWGVNMKRTALLNTAR